MAEWLGHFMSGWPTWAIGGGMIVIIAIATAYYFSEATLTSTPDIKIPSRRKKKNGKK